MCDDLGQIKHHSFETFMQQNVLDIDTKDLQQSGT